MRIIIIFINHYLEGLKLKKGLYMFLCALVVLVLAACGNTEDDTSKNKKENTDSEAITVSGVNGEVTLPQAAKKVVVLEYTYAEDMLALGMQPAGVADIEGFNKWVSIDEKLDNNVVDVGTRNEPNLEQIASLQPDLIIGISFRHEGILADLEKIAPTLLFNPYPTEEQNLSQYDEMFQTLDVIAEATGTETTAEQLKADVDTKIEEVASAVSTAELATKEFSLVQAFTGAEAPEFRVFTKNSMASELLEKIGLTNAYEAPQFEAYGYSTLNIEGLTNLEDANFIYVIQEDDPLLQTLDTNQVWQGLSFVKNDQLYSLGGDAWLFGGPLSALTVLDRLAGSFSK